MRTASKETILRIAGTLLALVACGFSMASVIVSNIDQSGKIFAIGSAIVVAGVILIAIWADWE